MSNTIFPFSGVHLKRYKDLTLLFLKFGRDDLLRAPGAGEHFSSEEIETKAGRAEDLAGELEKMGPTFVKLGQLLSTRADLLQKPYLDGLARLQDNVAPVDYEAITEIVSEELGVRISKAFASFDETPLASASLGQVHRATLRDGREVAVKVQRPGVRKQVVDDLESILSIANFAEEHSETSKRYELARITEEFRRCILRELDYAQEAQNLVRFRKALARFPNIVVPEIIPDLCSPRVLTMEYLRGQTATTLSGVALNEIDGKKLAAELFHAYLYQVLVLGSFHADPHPGNLLITPEHKIALLDLGMVGYVDEKMRETLAHFLIAVAEGRGTTAAEIAISMGTATEHFQKAEFIAEAARLVSERSSSDVNEVKVGSLVLAVTKLCADHGLRIPGSVVMLGKTLLNLDLIAETLDPHFSPAQSIREKSADLLREQVTEHFSLGKVLTTAREFRDLVSDLPAKANKVLDLVAENKIRLDVNAVDENLLIMGFQKIANRITAGLIVAALIIGAAMIMNIETSWKLFGYPGLAIILFLLAVGGALSIAYNILFKDK
jgi:ubiquinone biosynthesis protein